MSLDDAVRKAWFTPEEAAIYTGFSAKTLARAVQAGELRNYQRVRGGRIRYHRDHLDAWVRGEPPDPHLDP